MSVIHNAARNGGAKKKGSFAKDVRLSGLSPWRRQRAALNARHWLSAAVIYVLHP